MNQQGILFRCVWTRNYRKNISYHVYIEYFTVYKALLKRAPGILLRLAVERDY